MNKEYNCPNCGAPIGYSSKCQYCGTLLDWIPVTHLTITVDRPEVRTYKSQIYIDDYNFQQQVMGDKEFEEFIENNLARELLPAVKDNMSTYSMRSCDTEGFAPFGKVFTGVIKLVVNKKDKETGQRAEWYGN